MTNSRRDFLKTTGLTLTAAALPAWVFEQEAAASAMLDANKNKLADFALSTAKRLGATYADIRINRNRFEQISAREQQFRTSRAIRISVSACACS
jgi:TldD protein